MLTSNIEWIQRNKRRLEQSVPFHVVKSTWDRRASPACVFTVFSVLLYSRGQMLCCSLHLGNYTEQGKVSNTEFMYVEKWLTLCTLRESCHVHIGSVREKNKTCCKCILHIYPNVQNWSDSYFLQYLIYIHPEKNRMFSCHNNVWDRPSGIITSENFWKTRHDNAAVL